MKFLVYLSVCLLLISMETSGRKFKMKTKMTSDTRLPDLFADDVMLNIEPIPPMIGECQCECCEPKQDPIDEPPCVNDVVVAVDSSACFRDHHGQMMRFLKKLVRKIGRTDGIQYGGTETRLGVQQFSSDIIYPLSLSSFEHYTNPSSRRDLMIGINRELSTLAFLGEGAFLNKALNSSANHFQSEPRPPNVMEAIAPATPRRTLIVMTNGQSHPDVTMLDIDNSIAGLKQNDVMVFPVSVTSECHGVQSNIWNEGLCPDTVTLNRLAKVGRSEGATFMELTSQDTINEILNQLQCPGLVIDEPPQFCNNCTCSCELPVGPPGPEGPPGVRGKEIKGDRGEKGDIGPPGLQGVGGPKGNSGKKGDVGSKGNVGDKGLRKPLQAPGQQAGDEGVVGPKGDQGEVGEKGDKGGQGPKGSKGYMGAKGGEGEQGLKGNIGKKGDFGQKGEEGKKGEVGDKGYQGVKGDKGEVGVGIKGQKGQIGIKGPKGDKGNKGDTGDKGEEGRQGLCGQPGPAGKPGNEGIPGIDGIDGGRGPQGIQGPRGDRGERGERGEPGIPGEQGFPGELGLTGERGPEGPQGAFGRKGEKGEPSNERGVPGRTGPFGPKGEPGADGSDGLDGVQGPPGVQGPRGSTGPRGPEGTVNLEELRPIIADIVRELIPAECGDVPGCQEYPIDLAFLVDGSDSIAREEFDRVKEWILQTVNEFKPGMREIPISVDVVQYSEQSQVELHQAVIASISEIQDQIRNITQMRSETYTYTALQFVISDVLPAMRESSYKILITMTDGDASDNRNLDAIEEARANFNMMVSVGVGRKVDRDELGDFSSNGDVFSVDDFSALESTISNIVEDICTRIDAIVAGSTRPELITENPHRGDVKK